MRRSSAWIAVALLAIPSMSFGSGTPPPGKAEPAIVPYLCSDGHTASVVYQGGSDYRLAKAVVSHEGRSFEMRAAPTLYGVRYRTAAAVEGESGSGLVAARRAGGAERGARGRQLYAARARAAPLRAAEGRAAPEASAAAEDHGEDHGEAH